MLKFLLAMTEDLLINLHILEEENEPFSKKREVAEGLLQLFIDEGIKMDNNPYLQEVIKPIAEKDEGINGLFQKVLK